MNELVVSTIGSLIAAGVTASSLVIAASAISRSRARKVRAVLGREALRDPVIIRPSVIEAKRVSKPDGVSHEVKGNLLDSYENTGAYAIKDHLESPRWLSRLASALRVTEAQYGVSRASVIIDTPGRIILPGQGEDTKLDVPDSSPRILLGSGVFNPEVRELHEFDAIARIVDDPDETSERPPDQPRRRKIVMPGKGGRSYARKSTGQFDDDGKEIFEDYALIQRIIANRPGSTRDKVYFVIAGLGSGGTGAAIRYFIERWPKIKDCSKAPNGFTIVLTWSTTDFSIRPTRNEVTSIDPSENEWPEQILLKKATGA